MSSRLVELGACPRGRRLPTPGVRTRASSERNGNRAGGGEQIAAWTRSTPQSLKLLHDSGSALQRAQARGTFLQRQCHVTITQPRGVR